MNVELIQELIRVELLLQLRGPLSVRYSEYKNLEYGIDTTRRDLAANVRSHALRA